MHLCHAKHNVTYETADQRLWCLDSIANLLYEPRCEKSGLRGFRPGPTQTVLYNYRRWQEACNFGFRKSRDFTIRVAKKRR